MLFGSGLVVAIFLSMSRMAGGPDVEPPGWGSRPTPARAMPVAAIDLRVRTPSEQGDMRSLFAKRPPLQIKSLKIVGASGLGFYVPAADEVAFGVGVTTYRIAPTKRATQTVFGVRVRF